MATFLCAVVLVGSLFLAACTSDETEQTDEMTEPRAATDVDRDGKDSSNQAEPKARSDADVDQPEDEPEVEEVLDDPPPDEPEEDPEEEEQASPTATDSWALQDLPPDEGLAEMDAVVVHQAGLRLRPGLAWPVVERLPPGASVRVRARVGIWNEPGWLRISYGEEREGWVRAVAVDLSEAEILQLPERPAAKLAGTIQGQRVGVKGRRSDGVHMWSFEFSSHSPRFVQIARNTIDSLWDDVSFFDLPMVVGYERVVVFPSDQINIEKGRVLPHAWSWMWLPTGALRGYNGAGVWTWQPETGEVDLVAVPDGDGLLSPDGEWLAVFQWASDGSCDDPDFPNDVILVPLDGSNPVSLCEEFRRTWPNRTLYERSRSVTWERLWLADSEAILFDVLVDAENNVVSSPVRVVALMTSQGKIILYELPQDDLPFANVTSCQANPWGSMQIRSDGSFAFGVKCFVPRQGFREEGRAVFLLSGEFLRWEQIDEFESRAAVSDSELVRGAVAGEDLGADLVMFWSLTRRHAVVVSRDTMTLWLYDANEQRLRRIGADLANVGLPDVFETWDGIEWETHWHADEQVAVLGSGGIYPHEKRNVTALLVEAQTGVAVPFDVGSISHLDWRSGASWSPDGKFFTIRFGEGLNPQHPREGFWLDGLAGPGFGQVIVVGNDGDLVGAVRTFRSDFRGGWSSDSSWFAIGPSD
ncbi:MAG: SH3 domain-containing protein [Chloroflexi bacterium]|nr:SH3 domain-containing protein [Chloroflexota bacterium]